MGKRGPKPKDKVAPATPLKGAPKPPKFLDAEARKHWDELVGLLVEAGHLSQLDADALAAYCSHWSRWRRAEAELAKSPDDGGGEVITAVNRYRQLNPYYTVASDALRAMKSYLVEFGLSPKARSKLVMPEVEEVDPKWAALD
jgi:P27 family predicted phage terminase small subunit